MAGVDDHVGRGEVLNEAARESPVDVVTEVFIISICMKAHKVYLLLPVPNLRGYYPIACSGKPNPSKKQSHLGAQP